MSEACIGTEILAGDVGKTKFGFRRKLPGQIKLNALAQDGGFGQQLRRSRLVKFQKYVGTFDLDSFATVQLHLHRGLSL